VAPIILGVNQALFHVQHTQYNRRNTLAQSTITFSSRILEASCSAENVYADGVFCVGGLRESLPGGRRKIPLREGGVAAQERRFGEVVVVANPGRREVGRPRCRMVTGSPQQVRMTPPIPCRLGKAILLKQPAITLVSY
jgi:hypothetical protein